MNHPKDAKKEGFKKHAKDGITHGGGKGGEHKEHSAYEEAHESPAERKREEKIGEQHGSMPMKKGY